MTDHDAAAGKFIEDIKGIIAVLDPAGARWAEEAKQRREARRKTIMARRTLTIIDYGKDYGFGRFAIREDGHEANTDHKEEVEGYFERFIAAAPVVPTVRELVLEHNRKVVKMVNQAMGLGE